MPTRIDHFPLNVSDAGRRSRPARGRRPQPRTQGGARCRSTSKRTVTLGPQPRPIRQRWNATFTTELRVVRRRRGAAANTRAPGTDAFLGRESVNAATEPELHGARRGCEVEVRARTGQGDDGEASSGSRGCAEGVSCCLGRGACGMFSNLWASEGGGL